MSQNSAFRQANKVLKTGHVVIFTLPYLCLVCIYVLVDTVTDAAEPAERDYWHRQRRQHDQGIHARKW